VGIVFLLGQLLGVATKQLGQATGTTSSSVSTLTLVVRFRIAAEQFGQTSSSSCSGSIASLPLVVRFRVAAEQLGQTSSSSRGSVSALALVVCFRVATEQLSSTASTSSLCAFALVVRRASVEISPVGIVFLLGQLLSITAEELG
jgi:CRISPR/Cas system-associated exonuclease Cas4 (RecB family)